MGGSALRPEDGRARSRAGLVAGVLLVGKGLAEGLDDELAREVHRLAREVHRQAARACAPLDPRRILGFFRGRMPLAYGALSVLNNRMSSAHARHRF